MTAQQAQLIAKLQEIFQINQADLDFGIYRILNSRQEQINEFLQKTLPTKINTAFNGNFEQANSVYNHLYTFFSRYYDQGDFISQRRYKGDTYAIPYAGEEVMLHWANKDQYYTKSGENFSNYTFTLENGKKVQFRLVEADTAKDNRKDNDQVRVFSLIEPRIKIEIDENGDEIQTDIIPIEQNGDLLTIRFEYIAIKGTEQQRKKLQKEYILQAVEKIKNFAISDEFQSIFTLKPTDGNKTRTLLEKYLTDYTAKNTADYFIHKNLGKFLNQELDFYIKNEVMNLDNIQDNTDFSHIEQNLQTIKTLKTVAKEIIAFLAQLEDFQKKLWLKKKFVAGCHYLITLDHLTDEQVQEALDNPKQTAQWQALFNVDTSGQNAAEICKNYPHLVVDTSLFEPKFQAEVLGNLSNLDKQTNGLLLHSDNFQALNLLQERYKEQVKCIYIDPPYNTGGDGFIYKDNYQHSSWASLIANSTPLAHSLQPNNGSFFASIDDDEQTLLRQIIAMTYGNQNFINNIIWQKKYSPSNDAKWLSDNHDFIITFAKNKEIWRPDLLPRSDEAIARYKNPDNDPRGVWKAGDMSVKTYSTLTDYPITTPTGRIVNPPAGRCWRVSKEKFDELVADNRIWFGETGNNVPSVKRFLSEVKDGVTPLTLWTYEEVGHNQEAKKEMVACFNVGEEVSTELLSKATPKPIRLLNRILNIGAKDSSSIVLDYFAGSGSTAHAVIDLNREDGGNRKYILVEQGEYFDTVLKPRVQKVIFAENWKNGKPQADNGAFGGVSQIVKVLKLESYEDTLNNLALRKPAQDLADMGLSETVQNDYLLHYMLDVESRDSLLNTENFIKPFDYQLNIATTSAGAYETKTIDLVETFNYLIGLRVSEINDKRENGLVTVQGTNTSGEKTLIIWRDCEKYDYDKINRYLDSRDINPQDSEFDVVYINGDHNVPTVFADNDESVKTLKVRSIEAEFLSRMFGE
ncbi:site-specific DNA-methyltransferase [Histophilus somni]|uniref:site-specific DNA-methyltransferase n=1 Tax=Histophilus somni TaxID=731 RepID=UPI00201EAB79|nr:site-specific DNA-methyltransferase [Histophilus somni]